MQKHIIKGLLQRLANAPQETAKNYIETLKGADRAEAVKLATALGIYKNGGNKNEN